MTSDPKVPESNEPPAQQDDLPEVERQALLSETLRTLQEAFSSSDDEDDAGTLTELHQNPVETDQDQPELPL